jgi:hypothetical protein
MHRQLAEPRRAPDQLARGVEPAAGNRVVPRHDLRQSLRPRAHGQCRLPLQQARGVVERGARTFEKRIVHGPRV